MAGADGNCQGITSTALDEFASLLRVGQFGVGFADGNVFLNTPEHAQFRFDNNAFGVGGVNNTPGDCNVFFKGMAAGVNHDRAVETGVNAVIAGSFIAVVQVNREYGFRIDFVSGADQTLKENLIGVAASSLADLNDEGCLRVEVAAE
jgi:hypothetical protein